MIQVTANLFTGPDVEGYLALTRAATAALCDVALEAGTANSDRDTMFGWLGIPLGVPRFDPTTSYRGFATNTARRAQQRTRAVVAASAGSPTTSQVVARFDKKMSARVRQIKQGA